MSAHIDFEAKTDRELLVMVAAFSNLISEETLRVLSRSGSVCLRMISFEPWNLVGQWQTSQVSRAGRRSWTGAGMGRL